MLTVAVIAFALAVASGAAAASHSSSSGFWLITIFAAPVSVTLLCVCCAYRIGCTRIGPDGIGGRRRRGSRFEYRWSQIGDISPQARKGTRSGTTYSVIITTTEGRRLRLPAPVCTSGGYMSESEFRVQYAQIRNTWQSHTRLSPNA